MKITVINTKGEKTKRAFELDKEVFESQANLNILRQAIHVHNTNVRTGTAKTKDRAEVAGTGKKWGKNNKMGSARRGDLRSPVQYKGGVSHGPRPRNFSLAMPKLMKAQALNLALTNAVEANKIHVVEDFKIEAEKLTKEAAIILSNFEKTLNTKLKNAVIYYSTADENLKKAFRNLKGVSVHNINHMNPYDVISASKIFVFESAMELLNDSKAVDQKPKQEAEKKTTTAKTAAKAKTNLKNKEK